MLGKFVEHPFDTIKVRLQSQPLSNHLHGYSAIPLYTGPIDCFQKSWTRDGGYKSLYRGVSAPVVSAAIENSSLFFSYHMAKQAVYALGVYPSPSPSHPLPTEALVLCGAASGAFTSLLLTPVELIKCKLQVASTQSGRAPSISALMRQIYHQHGVVGFWRGQLGTLIRETGGGAAWFGTYEYINGLFRRYNTHSDSVGESTRTQTAIPSELLLHQQLFAGAAAGVMYNFTFYPADTIKSRMQTETTSRKPERPVTLQQKVLQTAQIKSQARRSFYGEALDLWRQQGLRGFYRGCGITVLRSAPSSALIFTVYEALRSNFS